MPPTIAPPINKSPNPWSIGTHGGIGQGLPPPCPPAHGGSAHGLLGGCALIIAAAKKSSKKMTVRIELLKK